MPTRKAPKAKAMNQGGKLLPGGRRNGGGRQQKNGGAGRAYGLATRITVPTVISSVSGNIRGSASRIQHREFVADIQSQHTANWHTLAYFINPAAPTFPWLKTIATGWEKYHFNKIEFEWVPNVSTITAGSMVGYFDYDARDVPAHEKGVALAHRSSINFQFCQPAVLRADTALLQGQRYVCSNFSALEGGDVHLYDVAHFSWAGPTQTSQRVPSLVPSS